MDQESEFGSLDELKKELLNPALLETSENSKW